MFKTLKIGLYSGTAALLLSSCGGGGGGSTSGYTLLDPKPNRTYTGSKDPSLLNQTNTALFASVIVGDAIPTDTLLKSETQSGSLLQNQTELLAQLSSTTRKIGSNSILLNRAVSETVACDLGGEASAAGDVNDEESTGVIIYTYKDCQLEEGVVINGKSSETINSNYDPEIYTQAFDGLKISSGGESYELTGTLDYSSTFTYEGSSTILTEKQVANVTTIHSPSQLSTYLQNYTSTKVTYPDLIFVYSLSGKVFLSPEGYVTVSNSSDYFPNHESASVIPKQGYVFMAGASQSKARISNAGQDNSYRDDYRLDLDENGDSIYELTSIQDSSSSEVTDLTANQPPVAAITVIVNSWKYGSHSDDQEYIIGTNFSLNSEESYDVDNLDLSYVWTIEEKPEGSTAALEANSDNDQQFSFTPDMKGNYKVSLKVTDDNGSQQSSIDFINISIANIEPEIETSFDYNTYYKLMVNSYLVVFADATDSDTFGADSEVSRMTIDYTWLERPDGSTTDFFIQNEYDQTDEHRGQTINNQYSLQLDKVGNYRARFTATDSDGASSTSLVEFSVRGSDLLEGDINCTYIANDEDTCNWESKTAKINERMFIGLTTPDEYFSNCTWEITSSATDSTGTTAYFSDAGYYIDFTAPALGDYLVETECEKPNEAGESTYSSSVLTIVE